MHVSGGDALANTRAWTCVFAPAHSALGLSGCPEIELSAPSVFDSAQALLTRQKRYPLPPGVSEEGGSPEA
jgi:hypothetical protein